MDDHVYVPLRKGDERCGHQYRRTICRGVTEHTPCLKTEAEHSLQ